MGLTYNEKGLKLPKSEAHMAELAVDDEKQEELGDLEKSLQNAIFDGDLKRAEELLMKGADPLEDNKGRQISALKTAVKLKNMAHVKLLMRYVKSDLDKWKKSSLISCVNSAVSNMAMIYGDESKEQEGDDAHWEIVTALREPGLLTQNEQILATLQCNPMAVEKALTRLAAAGVRYDNEGSENALKVLFATHNVNSGSALKILVDKLGVNPNLKDERGLTILMELAGWGHKKCAELLIRNGADVTVAGPENGKASDFAVGEGHPELGYLLRRLENGDAIENVLGTDVARKKWEEKESLSKISKWEGLKPPFLLDADMSLGSQLIREVVGGNRKNVRKLLSAGADPNATDINGMSALGFALTLEKENVFSDLLKAGADLRTKIGDWNKYTLGEAAFRLDNEKMLAILMANEYPFFNDKGHFTNEIQFAYEKGREFVRGFDSRTWEYDESSKIKGMVEIIIGGGFHPSRSREVSSEIEEAVNKAGGLQKAGVTLNALAYLWTSDNEALGRDLIERLIEEGVDFIETDVNKMSKAEYLAEIGCVEGGHYAFGLQTSKREKEIFGNLGQAEATSVTPKKRRL